MGKKRKTAPRRTASDKVVPAKALRKQPETLRLRSVVPTLTVNDLPASLAFYRDVLGFIVADEFKDDQTLLGAAIRAGEVDILLSQDDFAKGRDRSKSVGVRLYCPTRQDLDQIAEDIKARGGILAHEPTDQPWGARDFGIVDPDGFKISIAASEG